MKFRFLILAVAAFGVISCNKGRDLVGTWSGTTKGALGSNPQELTFDGNGSFRAVTTIMKGGKGLVMTHTGKWKLVGDKITYNFEDSVWATPGVDAATSARIQQRHKSEKATIISELNAAGPLQLKWVDDDKFIEFAPEGELTYTRKQ